MMWIGPSTLSLAKPGAVSIGYDPANLKGVAEEDLEIQVFHAGLWYPVPSTVDTQSHEVRAHVRGHVTCALRRHRASPPTATALPVSGSMIRNKVPIAIIFGAHVTRHELALGGTLASAVGQIEWSRDDEDRDDAHRWHRPRDPVTATLHPRTIWPEGPQSLTVVPKDRDHDAFVPLTLAYVIDDQAPADSVLPPADASIGVRRQIIMTFSETMNPAATVLSGSLATLSDGGVWTRGANPNDTLIVSPASRWPEGDQTLTVNARDLAGNQTIARLAYFIDGRPPTVTVSPPSGSTLTVQTPLVFTFDEAMDPASLSLAGSMTGDGQVSSPTEGAMWTNGNTVLRLAPTDGWSPSQSGSLTLQATDAQGNLLAAPVLTAFAIPETSFFTGVLNDKPLALEFDADRTFRGKSGGAPQFVFLGQYRFDGFNQMFTLIPSEVRCSSCPAFHSLPASLAPGIPSEIAFVVNNFGTGSIESEEIASDAHVVLNSAAGFDFAPPIRTRDFALQVATPRAFGGATILIRLAPGNGSGASFYGTALIAQDGIVQMSFSIPVGEFDTDPKTYLMLAAVVPSQDSLVFANDGSVADLHDVLATTADKLVGLTISRDDVSTAPFPVPFLNR